MKNIRVLSISLIIAGLAVFSGSVPAQAVTISPSVTATGAIGTSGTNAYPITLTATVLDNSATMIYVELPTGWSVVTVANGGATCPSWFTQTGINSVVNCSATNPGGMSSQIQIYSSAALSSGTTVTVTFAANSLNVAAGRNFPMYFGLGGLVKDNGTAVLGASVAPLSPSTPVTPVVESEDPTLAVTGINTGTGISLLAGGMSLALVGAELFMIARRKRTK